MAFNKFPRIAPKDMTAVDFERAMRDLMNDPGAVDGDTLADGSITTAKIADLAVTPAKLAASAVTTPKIDDLAVSSGKLANLAVTTGKIAAGAVTYAKIQDISATDRLLGRSTAGAGVVEEITCTAAGRALLDDAAASNQRTTLGLGTAAVENTGTSGGVVPLLNAINTWAGIQTFSTAPVLPSFTVGTLPSAATFARGLIYVSDETGGATVAFSDGSSWRRVQDRNVVS